MAHATAELGFRADRFSYYFIYYYHCALHVYLLLLSFRFVLCSIQIWHCGAACFSPLLFLARSICLHADEWHHSDHCPSDLNQFNGIERRQKPNRTEWIPRKIHRLKIFIMWECLQRAHTHTPSVLGSFVFPEKRVNARSVATQKAHTQKLKYV